MINIILHKIKLQITTQYLLLNQYLLLIYLSLYILKSYCFLNLSFVPFNGDCVFDVKTLE